MNKPVYFGLPKLELRKIAMTCVIWIQRYGFIVCIKIDDIH